MPAPRRSAPTSSALSANVIVPATVGSKATSIAAVTWRMSTREIVPGVHQLS